MNSLSIVRAVQLRDYQVGDLVEKDANVYIVTRIDEGYYLVNIKTGLRAFEPQDLRLFCQLVEQEGMKPLGPCHISVTPEGLDG